MEGQRQQPSHSGEKGHLGRHPDVYKLGDAVDFGRLDPPEADVLVVQPQGIAATHPDVIIKEECQQYTGSGEIPGAAFEDAACFFHKTTVIILTMIDTNVSIHCAVIVSFADFHCNLITWIYIIEGVFVVAFPFNLMRSQSF